MLFLWAQKCGQEWPGIGCGLPVFSLIFQLHHLAGARKYIYLFILCLSENLSTFVLKIFSNRKMNN